MPMLWLSLLPDSAAVLRRRSNPVSSPPRGFRYLPEFLSHDEEHYLISQIETLPFEHVQMHGVEGRREVVHFGVRYQLGAGDVLPAPPTPAFLFDLCRRVNVEARSTACTDRSLGDALPAGSGYRLAPGRAAIRPCCRGRFAG